MNITVQFSQSVFLALLKAVGITGSIKRCWCSTLLWKCKIIFLHGEGRRGVPVDLYRIFRSGTLTSFIHDKSGGKLAETISFYLLAITVVKYCRHQPHINQLLSDECAWREASCQGFLTSAISLKCSCSVFGSPSEFILFLILNNPQSEDK